MPSGFPVGKYTPTVNEYTSVDLSDPWATWLAGKEPYRLSILAAPFAPALLIGSHLVSFILFMLSFQAKSTSINIQVVFT